MPLVGARRGSMDLKRRFWQHRNKEKQLKPNETLSNLNTNTSKKGRHSPRKRANRTLAHLTQTSQISHPPTQPLEVAMKEQSSRSSSAADSTGGIASTRLDPVDPNSSIEGFWGLRVLRVFRFFFFFFFFLGGGGGSVFKKKKCLRGFEGFVFFVVGSLVCCLICVLRCFLNFILYFCLFWLFVY